MSKRRWTSVNLDKKQICFLDEISKNCKFTSGRKMSRTSVIRAFLRAWKKLDIDVNGVKSEEDLKERMAASFKRV